jgi:hypothetical protein
MTKSAFAGQFTSGHFGDTNTYKTRLVQISDYIYDKCLKFQGSATAAVIAALADPTNLDVYIVTTGGTINSGGDAITAATGDLVAYNASTELWFFIHDLA